MKRTSISGKSRILQPGVLKPRNEDFTPKNRQNAGQSARKSFVPKLGLADSAKRGYNRGMRGSTENIMRSSMASSRFTPLRTNSAAWGSQNINRMSIESARSSGIGLSTRKDACPITDPGFKTQCINKILEFLRNGYPQPIERRTLLTPSTKDFTNIFTFIYKQLDPVYVLPTRFEEEIPKLLRKLNYPIQITKSSFITVGSAHTWPGVLAMLVFLIDLVIIPDILNQDAAPPFEDDYDVSFCRDLYKCMDDAQQNVIFEEYIKNRKAAENVDDKILEDLQDEVQLSEHTLESLPNVSDVLKQLQQCHEQCSDDLRKLIAYCQDLQVAMRNKEEKKKSKEQVLAELTEKETLIIEEIQYLKGLQTQQGFSSIDLMKLKAHSEEVGKDVEQQESIGKDLQEKVWYSEMEISKMLPNLQSSSVQCEELVGKLELSEIMDMMDKYEDFNHNSDAIINKIMMYKKTAKKSTSQSSNKIWNVEKDITELKGILQVKQTESKRIETKIRHSEEELIVAQEEIRQEEQMRLEETEVLHQQIMESRKTHKKCLYQLQHTKEDKERELKVCKEKEESYLSDGAQFLKEVCHELLQDKARKSTMVAEFVAEINIISNQFHQSLP